MVSFVTRLMTMGGEVVGEDAVGNIYYRKRGKTSPLGFGRERRWVVYGGAVEASTVPPAWHAWLHHVAQDPPKPQDAQPPAKPWIQPHQPNLTGTSAAYRPAGSQLKGGDRHPATGDYEAWSPE